MPLSVDNCRLGDLFSLDSQFEFALHASRTMAAVEGKVVHRGRNGRLTVPEPVSCTPRVLFLRAIWRKCPVTWSVGNKTRFARFTTVCVPQMRRSRGSIEALSCETLAR